MERRVLLLGGMFALREKTIKTSRKTVKKENRRTEKESWEFEVWQT
jgi:hypothetical protein